MYFIARYDGQALVDDQELIHLAEVELNQLGLKVSEAIDGLRFKGFVVKEDDGKITF